VGKTTLIKAIIDACTVGNENGPSCHADGDTLTCKQNVELSGFYTEESRGSDGRRDGFDLICFSESDATDSNCGSSLDMETRITRTHLSRAQLKPNKRKPFVGKYLVDVDNVDQYGVKSLQQVTDKLHLISTEEESPRTICIIDEVGKMEMLCPTFLPAVHGVLDVISEYNNKHAARKNSCLLLGTIPTPRYGRVIPAVEEIRARDGVLVLHVTKNNRDELRSKLLSLVNSWIEGTINDEDDNESGFDYGNDLGAYLYQRPIGSGSMNSTSEKNASEKGHTSTTSTKGAMGGESELVACEPLVHSNIKPRVLLLGHTASPKPRNPQLAYCERSMWKILSRIHGMPPESISDAASATAAQMENYQLLVNRVLQSGICIWDVLGNVHVKGRPKRKGKRKTMGDDNDARPNALLVFLKEHRSIQTIAFIGAKAHGEFIKQFGKDALKEYNAVILPSSSPANSRFTTMLPILGTLTHTVEFLQRLILKTRTLGLVPF